MESDSLKRSSPPPPSYETAMGLSHPPPHNPYYPSLASENIQRASPLPMPMPMPQPMHIPPSAPLMPHHSHAPYPQQGVESTVTVVQVPVSTFPLPVGPDPIRATCPTCHKRIKSNIRSKNRYGKHICCFCLLSSVVCAICSCLPYFLCPPMEVYHTCPECKAYLGTYKESAC